MDATNFAYWLNGFAELHGDTPPTAEQWASIREHLQTVFVKVTPPVMDPGVLRKIGEKHQIVPQTWIPPLSPTCVSGGSAAQSYC